MRRPYGFLVMAAVLAAILCLFPVTVDAPEEETPPAVAQQPTPEAGIGVATGADLSERTDANTQLHRTFYYAPCGHSVQRREAIGARLSGLTRDALQKEIGEVIEGAQITGFSAAEVDITQRMPIPCPLHWVLTNGEDGMLAVMQNRDGETLELVRGTDVPVGRVPEEERQEIAEGRVFDSVQALEGYLESLSS
ncbi:MAG: hypothetical protein Q4G52_01735 [Clostridia bacterium]|nr:hypothetical protein [Clostridia bacterium]